VTLPNPLTVDMYNCTKSKIGETAAPELFGA
jgi:hypothetical protein